MLGSLKSHPYMVAIVISLLTAGLSWGYARTLSKDPEDARKTFNKTLAAGLIAALLTTWLVHRKEALMTEPFTAE